MYKPGTHTSTTGKRLQIAFFDYPDVYEDFYTHYHIGQQDFATRWYNTGSHALIKVIQESIGDVTWYALSVKPEIQEEQTHDYLKAKVKFLPSSWIHRRLWQIFYNSKFSWRLRKFYKVYAVLASYSCLLSYKIYSSVKKSKPDIILVQEYSSGKFDILFLYARLFGIPIICYHAGSTAKTTSGKFFRRFTLPRSGWIYPSGQKELKRLISEYKVPPTHLNIIRIPIDVNVYKPIDRDIACQQSGLNPMKRYWVYVGRLDDVVKRISAIIRVFSKIAEHYEGIDLLIIGTGNDQATLQEKVPNQLKNRIYFLGWIGDDEKKNLLYNCAECLLMASWREGFPTVIGEAYACGIPVISSDVGTISDLVIHEQTGWLFTAGDDTKMLEIYEQVAREPALLSSKSLLVRQIAEEHMSTAAIRAALKKGFHHVFPGYE